MKMVDVVMKLNGPIDPIGDSGVDRDRLANLNALCELTGELLDRIASVAGAGNDYMASVKAAKNVAAAFIADAGGVRDRIACSAHTAIGALPTCQACQERAQPTAGRARRF